MLGFRYREDLHGGFYFFTKPLDERAAELRLDVLVGDVAQFGKSHAARLAGPLTLEGFADDPRSEGKLVIDVQHQCALYELAFTGGGGAAEGALACGQYRLRGYKQVDPLNLVDSFTLLRASLYDPDAREIGRAVLRFDARGNLGRLVRSFRPTF
jgi:hypothetical protein